MASYNFKVVLLGQGCVGKTSLVLRYVSNVFNESHQSTLQASFLQKQLYLDRDLVRLNIWDTAGQEKFHALGPIYYREANGALLVYDVTNADSLRKVRDWVKELNKMLGQHNVCLAIIGNKIDLLTNGPSRQASHRYVYSEALIHEAIQFTEELVNAKHYLTSAKLDQGLGELFIGVSKSMIKNRHNQLLLRNNLDSNGAVNAQGGHNRSVLRRMLGHDERHLRMYGTPNVRDSRINLNDVSQHGNGREDQSSSNCRQCWK